MPLIDPALEALIAQIHSSGRKVVLEFAGAGSLGLFWLHAVAGSSRTLLEATDRYSPLSMADLLGGEPEQFVAEATARAMAERAYRRAMLLSDGAEQALGLALTATIATDRVKRGQHSCWVAAHSRDASVAHGLVLAKGARDRLGEESLVSRVLVRALAERCGVAGEVTLDLLPEEQLERVEQPADDPLARLLAGAAQSVTVAPGGAMAEGAPVKGGLLSGSFNPLHAGHEQLAHAASAALGIPVAFELPVVNADKPPLGYAEVLRRLEQFRGRHSVTLSRAPLFVQKAALFPGCVFVLGYDTAARLVEPSYYGGEAGLAEALATIRRHGCRFLVAGRVDDAGVFRTLADVPIPAEFADLFIELPERAFRSDLSSSAIRAQRGDEAQA